MLQNSLSSSKQPLLSKKSADKANSSINTQGIQKNVYVVIKNSPFVVTLASSNGGVNFNHVAFDCDLVYDVDGMKAVDYIKDKPFLFKAKPSQRGEQVELEVRLKVLTSQHEDMHFVVSVQGYDPHTKAAIPELHAYSHPIKVISKPEQIRKKDVTHKKTVNETIIDIITQIETTQAEHTKVLTSIYNRVDPSHPATIPVPPQVQQTRSVSAPKRSVPEPSPEVEFETHFTSMIKAYQNLPADQRASKLRRLTADLSPADSVFLNQLVDHLNTPETANFGLNFSQQLRSLNTSQDMPKNFADLVGDYLF